MMCTFMCATSGLYGLLLYLVTCPATHVASLALPKNPLHTQVKVLFDSTNHWHRSIQYHPEQSERITACVTALQDYNAKALPNESGLHLDLIDYACEQPAAGTKNSEGTTHIPLSDDELAYARSILVKSHSEDYVSGFETRCRTSRKKRIDDGKSPLGFIGYVDDDTFLTTETYDVCLRATAAWIRGVDLVRTDPLATAMALTRPPGHHATKTLSNGFCIFNFAAAAAIHAVDLGLKVSILDWDVHYGQGVSNILQHVPQTRYVSMHQAPAFPYQGEKNEISGACGNILTIPLPPDSSWTNGYQAFFEKQVLPFVYSSGDDELDAPLWEPDIVIVCAGYDALLSDELASCSLTAADYGKMTQLLRDKIGHGRSPGGLAKPPSLLFGLEGGYQLKKDTQGGNLADAVVETVKALGFRSLV
eukprot:CAMPEP_0198252242 /NCGR_PEP_ID=MMETSP1447-20131203/2777_1 /TAXON_ID=420782 /ORGANISM="Chaetoceros dichaeta, Strain CCMP1751" /LENGTH=418 /DNA_ID=CAMNT_0043937421 /DNA_START=16 /DNA_END=1272 /DNA_ORIENTATION=+